jgi:hypothetical protein
MERNMKKSGVLLTVWIINITGSNTLADPFLNLDFEMVKTNSSSIYQPPWANYLTGAAPANELLPSWELTRDGEPVTTLSGQYTLTQQGDIPEGAVQFDI